MSIEAIIDDAVVESISDGSYVRTLTLDGLSTIRNAAANITQTLSTDITTDLNIKILKALGFDDLEITSLGIANINKIIGESATMQTVTTYYQVDEATGNPTIITKDEFFSCPVDTIYSNNDTLAPLSNSNSGTTNFTANNFKTTILANYRPNYIRDDTGLDDGIAEDGWYTFIGQFTFYGSMPSTRSIDAASLLIAPSVIAWGDYSSDFSSTMVYTDSTGQSTTSYKATIDRQVEPEGFYYTWDLPNDNYFQDIDITGITISLQGNGRVSQYTQNCSFNIWARYEHIDTNFDIDFVWDETEEGIAAIIPDGVDITVEDDIETYKSYILVNYNP